MKVELLNSTLGQTVELLFDLELAGKASRHRTRFIQRVNDRLTLLGEEENTLLKEYSELDEDGEIKTEGEGDQKRIIFKDIESFVKEQNELFSEKMVFEGDDDKAMLMTVREVLDTCETPFKGKEAVLYDYLCEQFKVDENLEEEKAE